MLKKAVDFRLSRKPNRQAQEELEEHPAAA